jgi:hypothetical protein
MRSDRVRQYWREAFGVPDAEFTPPGIQVRPNSGRVAGRKAAWVFARGGSCLLSVPPELVAVARKGVQGLSADAVLTEKALHALFGNRVTSVIGPSYQGYAEAQGFCPVPCEKVRMLSARDRPALARLRDACDPGEWADSGLSLEQVPLFGYVEDDDVIAVAGVIVWASYAAIPAVLTHSGSRGQGCGTAVASAAMACILDRGSVVLYQTLLATQAAVRIAASLGCREYARMMCVGLGSNGAHQGDRAEHP